MTSNIGAERLQKEASLGFQADRPSDFDDLDAMHSANKDKVHDSLKKLMRPELKSLTLSCNSPNNLFPSKYIKQEVCHNFYFI